MNESFTEDQLRQAAAQVRDAMLASLPPEEDCRHRFSPAFLRRMRPLLRRQRHPVLYRAMGRAAALFLAVLLGGGAFLTASPQARAALFQWTRQVYESSVLYRFDGESKNQTLPVYQLTWIPEGYTEFAPPKHNTTHDEVYCNQDDQLLTFTYGLMQEGTALYIVDTDNAVSKTINRAGIAYEVYTSTDPALPNAVSWLDEEDGIFFAISGFLSEDDILHIADGVSLSDSTN